MTVVCLSYSFSRQKTFSFLSTMFRASQVLKALERIFWTDVNVYKNNPTMKAAAENAVKTHYEVQNLEEREVTEAAIR